MTKEQLIADLYSGLIDEKVGVSKVAIRGFGRFSCRVILKWVFRKLIWFIYCFRVPMTSKIQKDIKVFQSIDENLNKIPGCHKLT